MGKLFQSFQQVDSKRNRNIEGTGLGLAISQQLLKLKTAVESCNIDLCAAVLSIWRQIAASESKKNAPSADEVRKMLGKMQSALDDFDTLRIDDVLEQMEKMKLTDRWGELYFKLKKAAEDSDIDACCSIVEEWNSVL